jgi:hypothetical protein
MAYTDIDKPTDYFNTVLYTGNGSTNAITGVGFQPDFIWNKQRNGTYSHYLFNAITGTGKFLKSDSTDSEGTNTDTVTSFDSDGFTLGSAAGNNGSGNTMVSWNWLASNTTASNTDGSITSTVSANTTSGFSIVSYTGNATTGATIGHGLGVTPDVIIAKSRVSVDSWGFFHSTFSSQQYMFLNSTSAVASASSVWNALPSSSVFTVGDNASVNDSGNMIAYCFAEKKGFSKFGSYVGNGSSDGSYIHLGFSPSFVIRKRTDSADSWQMHDNKRDTFNVTYHRLLADDSGSEYTSTSNQLDFLSNGFKCRASNGGANGSGNSYIYMAFAENPFVTSTGVPATAR